MAGDIHKFVWEGDVVIRNAEDELKKRIQASCFFVEKVCKNLMRRGGRTPSGYRHRGEKLAPIGTYRSKPGEPPRVQTGTLKRSITTDFSDLGRFIGRVGTNVEYAPYLEFGTSRMAARPFLRPAVHRASRAIGAIFRRPLEKIGFGVK